MNKYNYYQVGTANLKINCDYIRSKVGDKLICAMVKANAYGVGVPYVVTALKGKVDYYGVSCVGEAKEVRRYDKDTPILVVGKTHPSELKWCSTHNVRVSISNQKEWVECVKKGYPIKVHIKVNTGLNRYGISSISALKAMLDDKQTVVTIEGIFTHFATKSADEAYITTQFETFQCFVAMMPKGTIAHCANSYTTLHLPEYQLDMVRVGYALYNEVQPVVSIKSKIIEIQTLEKGDTLGYDRTHKAKGVERIGVVPIGYADGLDRRLSNKFALWTGGHRADIVGNICMDVCFIRLDEHDKLGQEVEILGPHLHYNDYACVLGTSNYDVMLKWKYRRMQCRKIKEK